ncbi:ABC transporter ATP-binding protein [Motiliproteus sp.]|uniref:ABC transporter ATP-binding protein n=1 Tax=Motiliproteus sp. TaxID=1898955 RepID=UPI003BAABC92
MTVEVVLREVGLHYQGADQPLFENINLTLPAGSWSCLLGRSGCGKTSLLRMLAGLIEPEHRCQGQMLDGNGQPVMGRVAYMAQQDLLFPWLSVLDNVCLKARVNGGRVSPQERRKASELLDQLGIGHVAKQRPEQLSGGMRQRVALARTLMQDTPLVLMDEPFSALDAVTRHRLQALAVDALAGRTVLLITHDPQEALRLGDQVWLFENRRLIPVETPSSPIPRPVDSTLGDYQQQLLDAMQQADLHPHPGSEPSDGGGYARA